MVKVVYIGAFAEIELYIASEERYQRIKRGETVEFPTEFAEHLLEMATWTKAELPGCLTVPSISGSPEVGKTLTANHGVWTATPTSYAYQWYVGDEAGSTGHLRPIEGATSSTFVVKEQEREEHTPAEGQVFLSIAVLVSAKNGSGESIHPAFSQATAVVPDPAPQNITLPVIHGIAKVGKLLTVTPGTWTHSPTSTGILWFRTDDEHVPELILGASGEEYEVQEADLGLRLFVVELAQNELDLSAGAYSIPVGQVVA